MNWLAHALLVRPAPLVRAGSILADDCKGTARVGLPNEMLEGMRHHESVDRFTDAHPAVLRSKARVPPPYRRYAGILVDVFYGRLLAESWPQQHGTLADFLSQLHMQLLRAAEAVDARPQLFLRRLVSEEWIADYQRTDGHLRILGRLDRRLAMRFGKAVRLAEGAALLDQDPDGFRRDFAEFHPDLARTLGPDLG